MSTHPLDDPVSASLRGPHAGFARRSGRAIGYRSDIAPFAGWDGGDAAWDDLADLVGAGGSAFLVGRPPVPPPWRMRWSGAVKQMVADGAIGRPDAEFESLGSDDVPDMLELTSLTKPGPFRERTIDLGGYIGLRDEGGRLVAMAGRRFRTEGFGEVSAVCTHPDHRARGLGTRLVLAVSAELVAEGLTPFLHVATDNHGAIRLYERLGFTVRRELPVAVVSPPDAGGGLG